ncbi:hypothetical protein C8J57DRAFT_1278946 [Mycena rebaudengoi]|nr:hypothetical protein C8J57DRAFT_1278946 [Mycena rebaudengoi]
MITRILFLPLPCAAVTMFVVDAVPRDPKRSPPSCWNVSLHRWPSHLLLFGYPFLALFFVLCSDLQRAPVHLTLSV